MTTPDAELEPRADSAAINRYAIPALITGLVTLVFPIVIPSLVGIGLSIAALVQVGRLRRGGGTVRGGLAGVALAVSITMFFINLLAIVIVLTVLPRLVWILYGGSWDSPPSG